MQVQISIDVDDEYVDENSSTGLTEEGYETLMDAVNGVGTVAHGPEVVD